MPLYQAIDRYFSDHLDESIAELSELCRQPSVSAQKWGLEETASLVTKMLEKRGFEVKIIPTSGAPIVFAERKGRSNYTLLFYNHYDVQPAEPIELWESPPFEPVLRDADVLSFAEIEKAIAALGRKARDGKLTVEDLTGGTFTISNGGVYGSLMSTPILNPPQSVNSFSVSLCSISHRHSSPSWL